MSYREYHFLEPVAPLVVGIDIGRWYSGLALSHQSDRDNILIPGTRGAEAQYREPSVLLLNPDNTFHSYGYDAQSAFRIIPSEERCRYLYFTCFKDRNLVSTDFCERRVLRSQNGKRLSARTVYTYVFQRLKEKAIAFASESVGMRPESMVDNTLWMISIPNDASDSFKILMRESTSCAGIPKDRIRLVTESVSSLVYCLEHADILLHRSPMKIGQRTILVKASAHSIEFSVHEKSDKRSYTEVDRFSVEGIGGNRINKEIGAFFSDIFAGKQGEQFDNDDESGQDMNTEMMKHKFAVTDKSTVTVDGLFENAPDKRVIFEDAIESMSMNHLLEYNRLKNRLIIKRQLFEAFFLPWFRSLRKEIRKLVESFPDPYRTFAVICVGGPFESCCVKEWLSTDLGRRGLVVPREPGSVVSKGAVMMGYLEREVEERICRLSYGIPVAVPFVPGEHPETLKKVYDGEEWCENTFLKLIERGQVVRTGDTFILNIYSTAIDRNLKDNLVNMVLMKSKLRNPKYATHADGCSVLGKIGRKAPIGGWPKFWKGEIHLTIGEHDFSFRFINKTTSDVFAARINFM